MFLSHLCRSKPFLFFWACINALDPCLRETASKRVQNVKAFLVRGTLLFLVLFLRGFPFQPGLPCLHNVWFPQTCKFCLGGMPSWSQRSTRLGAPLTGELHRPRPGCHSDRRRANSRSHVQSNRETPEIEALPPAQVLSPGRLLCRINIS